MVFEDADDGVCLGNSFRWFPSYFLQERNGGGWKEQKYKLGGNPFDWANMKTSQFTGGVVGVEGRLGNIFGNIKIATLTENYERVRVRQGQGQGEGTAGKRKSNRKEEGKREIKTRFKFSRCVGIKKKE